MALYPRSDFVSVTVPTASGGCGQPHTRPVISGAPQMDWILECPACESYLRRDAAAAGYRKQRTVNEDAGMKLADRYIGLWGTTPDTVPETPDEEKKREHNEQVSVTKNAASQTQAMDRIGESIAAMAAQGRNTTDLMVKFMELQTAMLTAKPAGALYETPPGPLSDGPEVNRYTADVAPCQDCGAPIHREPGQKGSLPWRCPACKASKAGRRKVA